MTNLRTFLVRMGLMSGLIFSPPIQQFARAQVNVDDANYMLQACRFLAESETNQLQTIIEVFRIGLCSGKLYAVELRRSCHPEGVNNIQLARIVVGYLERNRARLHERCETLALEARAEAWPCKSN